MLQETIIFEEYRKYVETKKPYIIEEVKKKVEELKNNDYKNKSYFHRVSTRLGVIINLESGNFGYVCHTWDGEETDNDTCGVTEMMNDLNCDYFTDDTLTFDFEGNVFIELTRQYPHLSGRGNYILKDVDLVNPSLMNLNKDITVTISK